MAPSATAPNRKNTHSTSVTTQHGEADEARQQRRQCMLRASAVGACVCRSAKECRIVKLGQLAFSVGRGTWCSCRRPPIARHVEEARPYVRRRFQYDSDGPPYVAMSLCTHPLHRERRQARQLHAAPHTALEWGFVPSYTWSRSERRCACVWRSEEALVMGVRAAFRSWRVHVARVPEPFREWWQRGRSVPEGWQRFGRSVVVRTNSS